MGIDLVNRQRLVQIHSKQVADLVRETLAALGLHESGVTVAFVRDRTIRKLNRDFRGNDRETDVLSFPNAEPKAKAGRNNRSRAARLDSRTEAAKSLSPLDYLGDVVISTDTALRQAEESGLPIEREVSELIIHGVLHLCGYDHDTDRGEMNRLELKLRRKLLDD